MGPLIAEVFVLALVSGLDALAFIAVVVVSAQRRRNGTMFVTGWLLTLVVLTMAPAIVVHGGSHRDHTPTHRHLKAWLYLILGVVLIALAVWTWLAGRRERSDEVPKWYRRLQRVGPRASFLAGLVLPSIPAAIAAGTATFQSDLTSAAKSMVVVFFIAVSSISVVPPVVVLYAHPAAE